MNIFRLTLMLPIIVSFAAQASESPWFSFSGIDWKVRTDKTERPGVGKSTLEITGDNDLQGSGLLYAIAGKKGPVGFALVEIVAEANASAFNGLCFDFTGGPTGSHFQALLKDDQSDQPEGTLTFQRDFMATAEKKTYCFSFSEFTATIRGAAVSNFSLNRKSLESFSLQISRSSQKEPLLSISPLPFDFTLSGKVRFR